MESVRAGVATGVSGEVRFGATVVGNPHFFSSSVSGSTHEAFDVRSDDGVRVEVVDNVSIAPRVPVGVGDRVLIQGVLIPKASRGPLVHWTHHDPEGTHQGGFIEWNGRRYA
jgi:hypothetical protein